MMEAEIATHLTDKERYYAALYQVTLNRYAQLDRAKAMPLMAVRLYTRRVSFDGFLDKIVRNGTAWVAERCRREMTYRQEYMAHMMAKFPPANVEDGEGAVEEMAHDLAVLDTPAGGLYLLRYLDRLRERELAIRARQQQSRKATVH